MHVIAAKAVAFKEALQADFKTYAQNIRKNASTMAETLMSRDIKLVSGGTDNHLMLVDLTPQDITGARAQTVLDRAGITVNKNAIPYDTQPPTRTSGIRVGTPAVTTRGMGPSEMQQIGNWIADVLHNSDDEALVQRINEEVCELCTRYPVPGHELYTDV
jgi:glycine hydroxymethyltransferase